MHKKSYLCTDKTESSIFPDLQNIRNMKTETFAVSGMKCEHCKANVENALTALSGATEAVADLGRHTVSVSYDEQQLSPADLRQAVESSGRYELTVE